VLGGLQGPFIVLGQDPLLQRDVFQKLFDSQAVPEQETPSHYEGVVEQNQGAPQDAPQDGGNGSTGQPAGEQGRIDDQPAVLVAASPAQQAQEEATPAAAQPAPESTQARDGGDLLVAAGHRGPMPCSRPPARAQGSTGTRSCKCPQGLRIHAPGRPRIEW
jgi:hypothetical protein